MAGDVLALNALNDDARTILAGYDSYYGRPADTVAAELVGEIDEAGYFDTTVAGNERNIVLRLERGSELPRRLPRGRGGLRPAGRQRARRHEPARGDRRGRLQ